ncbi:MAG: hypothetical protein ABEJ89_02635 [Haloarculaceae archaeon]
MAFSLSPDAFVALDRASKAVGLVLLVVALGGDVGTLSVPLGVLGIAVGTATVFLDPPEGDTRERPDGATGTPAAPAGQSTPPEDGFLARFHNPRIALVALVGAGIWLCSFLVAGVGVALRRPRPGLAVTLLGLSGPLGLLGLAVLLVAAAWLGGRWLRRRSS